MTPYFSINAVKRNLLVFEYLLTATFMNNKYCLLLSSFSVSCILLFSLILAPISGATSLNISPPGSKPYGLTYDKHVENFVKWALGIPAKDNPVNDQTGEKCATGQSNSNSSVFYLTFNNGGGSERVCKIPAGKGLLIPIGEVEITNKDLPNATAGELKAEAKKDQDSVNSLYLKIGDKEYNFDELKKYRTPTKVFDVDYADNGLYGIVDGGATKAAADGFYVITEPLQKGNYTVHYKSSLACTDPNCAEPNFAQDIKYTIIAQ
jgi:hypothetical protein